MPNKDKIKFIFAECQVEITCAVCHLTFYEFPWYNNSDNGNNQNKKIIPTFIFNCPKCSRKFQFNFSIEPQNNEDSIKDILNQSLI